MIQQTYSSNFFKQEYLKNSENWAGRAALQDFHWALPSGNPSEQPCQPLENLSFPPLLLRLTHSISGRFCQCCSCLKGMIENENLCANQLLKYNLTSFGNFFQKLFKKIFSHFPSPKVRPLQPWRARTGSSGSPVRQPWRAHMVAVEAPSVPFIAKPAETSLTQCVSTRGDWLLYTGQTIRKRSGKRM